MANLVALLSCGHWFRETRPEDRPALDGEQRACADLAHYPSRFPARYIPDPGNLAWVGVTPGSLDTDWIDMFDRWFDLSGLHKSLETVAQAAWKAALLSLGNERPGEIT